MVPELEKPQVTEIQVRVDCNGCVQKIKRALHGISGINDIYVDFPQQKLTIIGWADPEKIVKAIKKTRKNATIYTHIEPTDQPAQPTEQAPEDGVPPPETENPSDVEAPPSEGGPPTDPPKEPPPPENPPEKEPLQPPHVDSTPSGPGQTSQPSGPRSSEEVHVVYHHQPDYGYSYGYGPTIHGNGGPRSNHPNGPGLRAEPTEPIYVTQNYNTYKPSAYVTEYGYVQPPPQYSHYRPDTPQYSQYSRPDPQQYSQYTRPNPPQYSRYTRPDPPQHLQHSRPDPLQHLQHSRPDPPQHLQHSRPDPPQHLQHSRPDPPQHLQHSRPDPPQHLQHSRPDPPQHLQHSRPDPPQYSHYIRPEPTQYSSYSRPEHYSETQYSVNGGGNGNITSIFSDENPNACNIV